MSHVYLKTCAANIANTFCLNMKLQANKKQNKKQKQTSLKVKRNSVTWICFSPFFN